MNLHTQQKKEDNFGKNNAKNTTVFTIVDLVYYGLNIFFNTI